MELDPQRLCDTVSGDGGQVAVGLTLKGRASTKAVSQLQLGLLC